MPGSKSVIGRHKHPHMVIAIACGRGRLPTWLKPAVHVENPVHV